MKICSKCKINKEDTEFNKNGIAPNGTQRYRYECKDCYNAKKRKSYSVSKTRVTELIKEYFGILECSKCGYNKCKGALDLHHVDPSIKDKNIAKMTTYSVEKIKAEIAKCILLCANCHRELHYTGK